LILVFASLVWTCNSLFKILNKQLDVKKITSKSMPILVDN
jgi:hypothetical protein